MQQWRCRRWRCRQIRFQLLLVRLTFYSKDETMWEIRTCSRPYFLIFAQRRLYVFERRRDFTMRKSFLVMIHETLGPLIELFIIFKLNKCRRSSRFSCHKGMPNTINDSSELWEEGGKCASSEFLMKNSLVPILIEYSVMYNELILNRWFFGVLPNLYTPKGMLNFWGWWPCLRFAWRWKWDGSCGT